MRIEPGNFVQVRGRPWLVESVGDEADGLRTLQLSCISDDAQGEALEVLWDSEIGAIALDDDQRLKVGRTAPDSPDVIAAHVGERQYGDR